MSDIGIGAEGFHAGGRSIGVGRGLGRANAGGPHARITEQFDKKGVVHALLQLNVSPCGHPIDGSGDGRIVVDRVNCERRAQRLERRVDVDGKKDLYVVIQTLCKEFKDITGSVICRELLSKKDAADDSPQPAERTAEYYRQRGCAGYVACAAGILEEYLCANFNKKENI